MHFYISPDILDKYLIYIIVYIIIEFSNKTLSKLCTFISVQTFWTNIWNIIYLYLTKTLFCLCYMQKHRDKK